jgi:4-hydroxy-3-methylbut-2-enyl diphosphate reductase
MKVEIDQNSGYCFGVEYAIQMAEDELDRGGQLYCLGDIVHNAMEVERLERKGLQVITREELGTLHDCRVLIRAHGEPPATYELAIRNNIELIDASCPVVLKLQNRVKHSYDRFTERGGQVVIYGQKGHAEVEGLSGQTSGEAIVVTTEDDLANVDFTRPVTLFSQTTKSMKGFYHMREVIGQRLAEAGTPTDELHYEANDSICRQVSNREPQLQKFAQKHDVLLFVSGKKSSNGKALFASTQLVNECGYFIENAEEIDPAWLEGAESVGICGATSTPMWLMEEVRDAALRLSPSSEEGRTKSEA